MKFKFRIQDYQTEAVDAVVKVFEGQPFNDRVSYLRDVGKNRGWTQSSLFSDDVSYFDGDGSGFENAPIELSDLPHAMQHLFASIAPVFSRSFANCG